MAQIEVWFRLLLVSQGGRLTEPNYVTAPTDPPVTVKDFRKLVKRDYAKEGDNVLMGFPASELRVYLNENAFNQRERPLYADFLVSGVGVKSAPFVVEVMALTPHKIETAVFELYKWKSKSIDKPYRTMHVQLFHGKAHLVSILQNMQNESAEMHLWSENTVVKLDTDPDGYTLLTLEKGKTYKFMVKTAFSVDFKISLSTRRGLHEVTHDFGITTNEAFWNPTLATVKIPNYLLRSLSVYSTYNTMLLEHSRRLIVSLLLCAAVDAVESDESAFRRDDRESLCVDEETLFNLVKPVQRGGQTLNAKFSGRVDYVIGHSLRGKQMTNDSAVLLIEVKRTETFNSVLPQALTQAATCLEVRKRMRKGTGKTFFVMTDGQQWIFAKLEEHLGTIELQQSQLVECVIRKKSDVDIADV
ncbi:hypothetical protein HDU96_003137, partial [Phlyctochytrium bullatum]